MNWHTDSADCEYILQVDAFTDCEFKGNPAAVCLLEEEREDEWLQSLAAEFNISETCFLTRIAASDSPNTRFQLRWFTPVAEVNPLAHFSIFPTSPSVCIDFFIDVIDVLDCYELRKG